MRNRRKRGETSCNVEQFNYDGVYVFIYKKNNERFDPEVIGEAGMSATTVRVRQNTREQLRELEALTGQGPTEVLARAVDAFRRSLVLANTNVAYGSLRADPASWAEIEAERAEWDATLADNLEA